MTFSFIDYLLTEELTDKQKKKVDNMPSMQSHIKDLHKKNFGDSDKIIMPYERHPDDATITTQNFRDHTHYNSHSSHVIRALQEHGYHTDDYESGLAYHRETPNRKMKIGKILAKEGIDKRETAKTTTRGNRPLNIGQLYAADPLRASSDKAEKQIVISKHPYDVAGMSTGRSGWESCMNLDHGQNKRYVPSDLRHGTLTAYVTKKGDDNINEPIGRLNLKRFDSGNHTIYRPEGRGYGSMPHGAIKKIKDWSEEKYPSRPGMYLKHPDLYNDDGNQIKIEKPEEINNDHKGSLNTLHHMIKDLHRSHEDYQYDSHGEPYDEMDDAKSMTLRKTNNIMDKMHPAFQLHTMVHQIADRTDDNNKDFSDIYEPNAHEFTQEWARNKIDNTNLKTGPIAHEIKNLTPEHALTYHKVLQDSGTKARDPDDHPEHHELHAAIIDHIMKHGPEEHKNSVLSDITDESHGHDGYYTPLMNSNHTIFDNTHLVEHTTNPRLMHTMLSRDLSRFDSQMDTDSWNHVGKHADSKLTHELVNGDLAHHFNVSDAGYSPGYFKKQQADNLHAFHEGLSKNPEGEHIQHEILQNMNFHGGENPSQDVKHSRYTDILDRNRASGRQSSLDLVDPATDKNMHSHFTSIAATTPHESVKYVMKHREDFKHDTDIQNELEDNK